METEAFSTNHKQATERPLHPGRPCRVLLSFDPPFSLLRSRNRHRTGKRITFWIERLTLNLSGTQFQGDSAHDLQLMGCVFVCLDVCTHNDWRQVQVLPMEPWALCGQVWPNSLVLPKKSLGRGRYEVVLFSLLAASDPIST